MSVINFDDSYAAGTIISQQFEGVEFSSDSEFGVMLFDTDRISGEDFDLAANDLGKVLIISEDGNSNDPDDNAAGGTVYLDFAQPAKVNSLGLLDIDQPGGSIVLYDEQGQPFKTVEIPDLGDNSLQTIDFDLDNVTRIELNLAASGAVTEIDFDLESDSQFSKVYAFGDSLVDTGNLFNATSAIVNSPLLPDSAFADLTVIPPSPPYFEGRLSNGSIWLDNLAQSLDIDITPATELTTVAPGSDILSPVTIIDGAPALSPFFNGATTSQSVNFAYALATTGITGRGEIGSLIPGTQQQVDIFIADHQQANQPADAEALYVLWAGSNDYFAADSNPEVTVSNLETQIESLYELGGRSFLVVNLPDLGILPEANNPDLPVSASELSALSARHNSLLDSGVEELQDALTGADIAILDVDSLFADVVNNPEEFGLTNVSEPFLDPLTFTPTVGANPDEFLFFDTLHPTQAGQELVSDLALETLAIEADL